ncbi:thioesterase family protein [Brevibacterium sp. 5221]|uniref:Thioesterase family protein n=1 Tax=Brevibacterium rongguiense TaxID=2695267 RepID=A0A6N9H4V4_9MICO|nr:MULTISPECIES: thioesterase family protein [Brevibacterium]MYM18806.1 thioesterase family protein [Brevibacterium rongguiense]WAL39878.1 thioesterase family protein [Brevibacterium sp. BRM-1]
MSVYFERVGRAAYRPTEHVSGAWDPREQHISPAVGLLVHLVESDRDSRRSDGLQIGRISCDILGTVPMDTMSYQLSVLRPGRTIELVEAKLLYGGRTIVIARMWLMQAGDTAALAASPLPEVPGPDELPEWSGSEVWPGGFIASTRSRRAQREPGRAMTWLRTDVGLVDDAEATRLAQAAALFDGANGLTVRADPARVMFPNVDLTAHLFRTPGEGWLGYDTSVSFGPTGLGLTHTVLHDEQGPVGALEQCLTVRPLAG